MTPVPLLYEMTEAPLSEVEEILLLKVLKSVEERYPLAPVEACVMARVLPENVSGAETVVPPTTPLPFVERSALGVPETVRAEVEAVKVKRFVDEA
jgi:hypothetical protein